MLGWVVYVTISHAPGYQEKPDAGPPVGLENLVGHSLPEPSPSQLFPGWVNFQCPYLSPRIKDSRSFEHFTKSYF